jgi:hypothetical protein
MTAMMCLLFCVSLAAMALTDEDASPASASPQSQTTTTPPSAPGNPADDANDDKWHTTVTPYLWFPGIYGNTGNLGKYVSVQATPGDLLSHFNIGLMGYGVARKNRLLLMGDFMWVKLSADKALPFPALQEISANVKATQFFISPEVGVRMLDDPKFKIDGFGGVRFWHMGQTLRFTPSVLGKDFSAGKSWADPIFGMRFQAALSPKISISAIGDAAMFGLGSKVSYEGIGLLGYNFNPKWTMQVGYRYLKVDYQKDLYLFNVIMKGAVIGATYNFK